MRALSLLVLLTTGAAWAQETAEPDTLDPRGYFPLAVGNEWEYRHSYTRGVGQGTEYLQLSVDAVDSDSGRFTLIQAVFAPNGIVLSHDTSVVRYTAVAGWSGGSGYTCVAAERVGRGGEAYDAPVPYFACDLDLPLGRQPPAESFGHTWMWAERLDSLSMGYRIPPFLPGVDPAETKGFSNYSAGFDAVHGFGFVYGDYFPEGCQFLCDSGSYRLTYARVGGREYGARSVAAEPAPAGAGSLRAYPNPSGAWVTVDGEEERVELYDVRGRHVLSVPTPLDAPARVDVRSLRPGTYAIRRGRGVVFVTVR